jgi:hypothetical protein
MNLIMNQKNNNLLQNIDNYNKILDCNNNAIFTKYISLIEGFLRECSENVSIHNIGYYKYVLKKGVETLSHIFNILLLYTNNLELTFGHSQQAYHYYIEFIGQIGDDNHGFLQLNSNDAIMFVYKKTLFDINNEYRKMFEINEKNKDKIQISEKLINIYIHLINVVINDYDFTHKENNISVAVHNKINKILSKTMQLNLICEVSVYKNKLETIDFLLSNIICDYNTNFFSYIDLFLKKIKIHNITVDNIQRKKYKSIYIEKKEGSTPQKFINWLCELK